jgi:NAD/NADP transhydrogenase alpha subunit
MRYFRPKSLTWWSGVASVATGVAAMVIPDNFALGEFGRFIAMLAGGADASPAALIFLGTGLIGIRDRLERAMNGKD